MKRFNPILAVLLVSTLSITCGQGVLRIARGDYDPLSIALSAIAAACLIWIIVLWMRADKDAKGK
ncbi:hypothetical protein [Propionicimonas sp.]|uniref:hypothetical protein n=1 Tax=Propionicimonas sp. TaxID=1955623 RepID=UPI00180C2952|nr:hypothetical protein [Propionicimonas sp.]MBU3975536.1 hypothetical protein [Actinomycetota bacterium]MBA3020059.1 hypothetical protein [Propionicimonas sp.]MBU3986315.1 hypothetical protein [Actinomycetota bacterium]MBU4007884.1 hypothetical protein [Actinomycetota bacterium]MBU4064142.1 hypothetical protein [Actinomycetota bacterium]